ncbi:MAG: hypothetical protein HY271_12440 [Deltaproteobacteria bacterium]|nr:hypothetical protein [Deltaproteobacteria bacterium]
MTDREDPMCTPPANGGFVGLNDPSAAKGAVKCQKAIEKASARFVTKKIARLGKCVDLVFACVQLKNGDQTCTDKAKATCDKQVLGIAADEMAFQAALEKACDDSQGGSVSFDDALALTGLGYTAEDPLCPGTFSTFSDIAGCIIARHECGAERTLVAAAPRAAEMLTTLGHDPTTEFPCLAAANGADGAGAGIADPVRAKAAVKCQAAIKKAGLKLAKAGLKTGPKCTDAAATCIQLKPGAACQAKAAPKCQAAFGKFGTGVLAKLLVAAAKKCDTSSIGITEIDATAGLGFVAAATRCSQFNLPLSTPVELRIECVGGQHLCEGAQMLECEAPRLREYADFLGVQVPEGL